MAKPVVLLVEDEDDLLEVMAFAVGRALPDHEVLSASTAADALEVVERVHSEQRGLALAMVDHLLGGESGLTVVERIRELHPGTPMLMLTGQATPDVEERAQEVGVRVLWKPMRLKQIVSEVASAIAGA